MKARACVLSGLAGGALTAAAIPTGLFDFLFGVAAGALWGVVLGAATWVVLDQRQVSTLAAASCAAGLAAALTGIPVLYLAALQAMGC